MPEEVSGEGVRASGIRVLEDYEPPCRSWELNQDPLEESPGLLSTEPSLQLLAQIFNWIDLDYCLLQRVLSGDPTILDSGLQDWTPGIRSSFSSFSLSLNRIYIAQVCLQLAL